MPAASKARAAPDDAARAQTAASPWPAARRWLLWFALATLCVFVALAVISYNAADRPTHTVWPPNAETRNWMGPVGAHLADRLLRTLGFAVTPALLAAFGGLAWTALGRPLRHPLLRTTGVLLIAAAAAGLLGTLLPGLAPMPGLGGGTLGLVISGELAPRFGPAGASLWLLLALVVGLVIAMDRTLWHVLAWSGRTTLAVARRAGLAAKSRAAERAEKRRAAATPTDLERAGAELAGARAGGRRAASAPEPKINEDAGGLGGVESFDPAAEAVAADAGAADDEWDEGAPARDEEPEEDEDEEVGAPQVFDQDALREKISKLPVRFAGAGRKSATEADLLDLQNAARLEGYRFPGLDLLEEPEEGFGDILEAHVREQAEALEAALKQYKIDGEVVGIESGPVITLYHVLLAPGTKVAALNTISSDLARALKSVNIRIVSNMQGRDTVGIEVPNAKKEKVRLKELMSDRERFEGMTLPMFLGKDASGDPLIGDLTRMPHMLIAGTTGSGKSVCMNTIIMSFLFTKKPNELKLVLVDPKMVEMSQFKDIPHLMCPVVTEMSKAAAILEWAVGKMDERYELLAEAGCRDINSYNELTWEELRERFEPRNEAEEAKIPRKLPYIVFIIDELADLMMTNKEVEGSIIRIAQKARAVGIHLILATQRPQANVVTGLIKGNMPCRISFKVASNLDSRIVLDQKGGELLLGQGDMLFLSPSSHKLMRAQGTLVDDKEIRRVTRFLKDVAKPSFERSLVQLRGPAGSDEDRVLASENNSSASLAAAQEDPMFDRAVEIVLETKRGSVSLLQRRLAIGYTRASRLIDLMGIAGIIGEHKGSVAREVLITPEEWAAIKELAQQMAAEQGLAAGPAGAHPDDPDQQMLFAGGSAIDNGGAPGEAPPFDPTESELGDTDAPADADDGDGWEYEDEGEDEAGDWEDEDAEQDEDEAEEDEDDGVELEADASEEERQ